MLSADATSVTTNQRAATSTRAWDICLVVALCEWIDAEVLLTYTGVLLSVGAASPQAGKISGRHGRQGSGSIHPGQ